MSATMENHARQLAVLQIRGRLFSIGLERMEEIVDRLDVTPTPQTPPFFLGLANLRGGVVPVLDAGVRLGLGASEDAGRQYVLIRPQAQPPARSDGQAVAVAVDRVRGVIDANVLEMTLLSEVAGLAQADEYVRGTFRCDAYDSFVLCLDPDALCRFELTAERAGETASSGRHSAPQAPARRREPEADCSRLLPVEAGGALYGLPLENLLRIIPYVEPVAPPCAAPGLLGLVHDCGTVLPTFGLRELLGADGEKAGERPRHIGAGKEESAERPRHILVLDLDGARAGLAVDGLRKIIAAPGLASCSRGAGSRTRSFRTESSRTESYRLESAGEESPGTENSGVGCPGVESSKTQSSRTGNSGVESSGVESSRTESFVAKSSVAESPVAEGAGSGGGPLVRDAFRLDDGRLMFVLDPEALVDCRPLGLQEGPESEASPSAAECAGADEALELHIRFGLGGETFAVPMDRIREVAPVGELTPVPQAPGHLVGLLNLRGAIVPAMDLRTRLGIPQAAAPGRDSPSRYSSRYSEDARVLVAESKGGQLSGLIVDRVHKPLRLARRLVEPLPGACLADGGPRFILGVARTDAKAGDETSEGRTVLLMDLDAVVNDQRGDGRRGQGGER